MRIPLNLTNVAVLLQAVADVLVDDRAELVVGAAAVLAKAVLVGMPAPGQDVA